MITRMTGLLARVLDEEVRLRVGPLEYQVLVPEAVRRQVQLLTGQEVTLHITEYLEGNQAGSRFVPRRIGFLTEAELEFFELFCTVDKIGVKKALKAMGRPVREIANAISREDVKWLATLPGIGPTSAEQITTTLKRKVTKLVFASDESTPGTETTSTSPLLEEVYLALMALGVGPAEARTRIDQLVQTGATFETVSDAINLIYAKK
jgi:Holliday junction DNA helicase RuvA